MVLKVATPNQNLTILAARISQHLSPAEKKDLTVAAQWIRDASRLLLECRDALPAISLSSARLHNLDLSLGNRIEELLTPWRDAP